MYRIIALFPDVSCTKLVDEEVAETSCLERLVVHRFLLAAKEVQSVLELLGTHGEKFMRSGEKSPVDGKAPR